MAGSCRWPGPAWASGTPHSAHSPGQSSRQSGARGSASTSASCRTGSKSCYSPCREYPSASPGPVPRGVGEQFLGPHLQRLADRFQAPGALPGDLGPGRNRDQDSRTPPPCAHQARRHCPRSRRRDRRGSMREPGQCAVPLLRPGLRPRSRVLKTRGLRGSSRGDGFFRDCGMASTVSGEVGLIRLPGCSLFRTQAASGRQRPGQGGLWAAGGGRTPSPGPGT